MRSTLIRIIASAAILCAGQVYAAEKTVKIGVLTDMSSLYADNTGEGSVLAARMAAQDFADKMLGVKIEIVFADHQNKADIAANIARKWIEVDKVDVIVDVPNSAAALAVSSIVKDTNKVLLVSGAGVSDLTGKFCNANTIQWTYDTWMLANGLGRSLIESGDNSVFFLTADYAFGHAMERDLKDAFTGVGGKVLGRVSHPINASDFSSFLLQAQASQAKVVALANGGADTINSIKQAREFGLTNAGQKISALIVGIYDLRAVGLDAAQGLLYVAPWYWNRNDESRAFAHRFSELHRLHNYPSFAHAGVYSAVLHYLKAVASTESFEDGAKVVAKMKEMPTLDPIYGPGSIRLDGRKIHPVYLLQAKSPAESKGAWDFEKMVSTIKAEDAFRPMSEGGCPLVGR